MLWVLEGARSLGLWVFVTAITAAAHNRAADLEEEIKIAELEARLAKVRGGDGEKKPEEKPEEKATDDPPMDVDTFVDAVDDLVLDKTVEDPVSTTSQQERARKGGQASQHGRRADKNRRKIPVTDDRHEDEMFADKPTEIAA
jgi:uncharacterized membrane protein